MPDVIKLPSTQHQCCRPNTTNYNTNSFLVWNSGSTYVYAYNRLVLSLLRLYQVLHASMFSYYNIKLSFEHIVMDFKIEKWNRTINWIFTGGKIYLCVLLRRRRHHNRHRCSYHLPSVDHTNLNSYSK